MPTLPISPATFDSYAPDPATLNPGLVKRARRVAARAKAIIENKGWTKGQGISFSGGRCLSQAINEARNVTSKPGLEPLQGQAMTRAVIGILEEARPKVTRRAAPFHSLDSVVNWNDKPNRTKEQALALLDKAANG